MSPKVPYLASIVLILYSCIGTFILILYVISLSAVALANALACMASLEAEHRTNSKPLKDADAAKACAGKAAKAAEARAIKVEKA
jgi:hypothetical protein